MRRRRFQRRQRLRSLPARDAKGVLDAAQAGRAGTLRGLGDLFEEVAAEGIVRTAHRAVGLADELRNQMQVPDGAEERGQIAERLIDADLFQVRLGEPFGIRCVFLVRPVDQRLPAPAHALPPDAGPPPVVLVEGDLVPPRDAALSFQIDGDLHVGIPARGQAADAGDTAAARVQHGFPEAVAGERDVPEKAKGVQEVRLAGGVRPHEEQAVPDGDVHLQEVLPVPQAQTPEPRVPAHRSFPIHRAASRVMRAAGRPSPPRGPGPGGSRGR